MNNCGAGKTPWRTYPTCEENFNGYFGSSDAGFALPVDYGQYGQIVRWYRANDDHADAAFEWDLFVMAGNPALHPDTNGGSEDINEGNLFNAPDGMMFVATGLLWIQTDSDDSNEGDFAGMGNNQMLSGDPATGRIERFLTGSTGSEVTGLTWSADQRTMFVGIQHPGGSFPYGEGAGPRSAIIAVKRGDNAPVG